MSRRVHSDVVLRQIPLVPLFALFLACGGERAALPSAMIRVGEAEFLVEIARRPPDRSRGLSGRPSLAADRGMLFAYDDARKPTFTMRDMDFDLDLIWISDLVVVGMTRGASASPAHRTRVYPAPVAVDMVLEVAAGTAEAHGWKVGIPVRLLGGVELHTK